MHANRTLIALAIAGSALFGLSPAGLSASSSSLPADIATQPALSRTVTIDGRQVEVSIRVYYPITGNIPIDTAVGPPQTYVTFQWLDGGAVPLNVRANRVRFEKLRGDNRVIKSDLSEQPSTANLAGFTAFGGQLDSVALGNTRRLRATIRLIVNGEQQFIRMGTLTVDPVSIVQ